MWSYSQGFGKPFLGSTDIFCEGVWQSKPLKIRPLQAWVESFLRCRLEKKTAVILRDNILRYMAHGVLF
jgi:hypothetical protein